MEHAKRMVLIEPHLIEKINSCNTSDNPTSRLDAEMKKILSSKLDDRKKCILYLQVLQRYLHFNEENRRPIEVPVIFQNDNITKADIKDETQDPAPVLQIPEKETQDTAPTKYPIYNQSQILSLIPKSYCKKGESILNILSLSKNKVNWNEDNGLVMIDGKTIPGSNIVDLINDLLRPLKNNNPIGWEDFATALKDLKIPLTYLGNAQRIDFIKNLTLKDLDELSTDEEYSTPTTTKISRKKFSWEKWNPY
ncbi:unnamed protein product [Leptosia nina]|uniref:Uncharacterized protein n=1 Tax=Leptosia nina TaxID=320188 RepID=A0AAV1JC08_9NEOP